MQSSKLLGLLIPSFFVLACGSTALLGSADDMRQSGGAAGSSQDLDDCSACFEVVCAWQTAQCQGDPRCATWLSEVRACGANGTLQPAQSCIALVSPPDTPSGKLTADALSSCLGSSGGCCSSATLQDGGTKEDKDSQTGAVDALLIGADSSAPDQMTCKSCVDKFKSDETDSGCGKAVRDCNLQGQCRAFMLGYFLCFPDPKKMTSVVESGDCLMALANGVSPAGQVQFMASVLGCKEANAGGENLFSACKDSCIPSARRDCMSCEDKACPDVMDAYLNSADAQKLMWCREAANGDSKKLLKCGLDYSGGAKVLQSVAQCTQASCPVCE